MTGSSVIKRLADRVSRAAGLHPQPDDARRRHAGRSPVLPVGRGREAGHSQFHASDRGDLSRSQEPPSRKHHASQVFVPYVGISGLLWPLMRPDIRPGTTGHPMHGAEQNFIGGTWVPAVAAAPNVNPSNLNDVIADYARAQPAEADLAVATATAAFAAYSCSTPQERFEALKRIPTKFSHARRAWPTAVA